MGGSASSLIPTSAMPGLRGRGDVSSEKLLRTRCAGEKVGHGLLVCLNGRTVGLDVLASFLHGHCIHHDALVILLGC